MNNIEKKLSRMRFVKMKESEKDSLWNTIVIGKSKNESVQYSRNLLFNNFKINMIAAIVSLFIILGGGGVAVASNASQPGDTLFPVDLAVERLQLNLAGEAKKSELKVRFANERVEEITNVVKEKSGVPFVDDLSGANLTDVEAEVFLNETIIKIEAGDHKYGFLTTEKDKEAIIALVASKYSLDEAKVTGMIRFSVEDRDSRADDKEFLNRLNAIAFSDDEAEDIGESLTLVNQFVAGDASSVESQKIQEALKNLLVLLGSDSKVKIEMKDGEIKIKMKGEKMEIEMESKNEDDDGDDDSNDNATIETTTDVKESDDEVFCRGEWRDKEDCPVVPPTSASGIINSVSINTDIQEDDTEVFCRGEWRDEDDCDDDSSDDNNDDSDSNDDDSDDSNDDNDNEDDDGDDDSNSGSGGGNDDDNEDDD
jgi:hypothetical protein